jgi:hypothetical protein
MAVRRTDRPRSDRRVLNGVQRIPSSSHSVAAFVGRTERGPIDEAIAVRNYNHFRQVFGGHATFGFMSYAVQHFFLHGGKSAVVVRVANGANRALIRIPAGSECLELQAKQPGSREFIRVSIDYDDVQDDPQRFNLTVQRLSRPGSQLVEDQEIFSQLSVDPISNRYAQHILRDSRLIQMQGVVPAQRPDATRPRYPGDPIPYLEAAVMGSDGTQVTDYDIIGSTEDATGLFSLDSVDRIDFLCLPPQPGREHGTTTFLAAERYCRARRALLIWDPPASWQNADLAVLSARANPLQGRNALTYYPRIRSRLERAGLPTELPACGAIAGILSNKSSYGEWNESSESDRLLKISLAPVAELSDAQVRILNREGINVLMSTRYGGAAFRGNVTLAPRDSAYTLWKRLDRRQLLLFIIKAIENAGSEALEQARNSVAALEARIVEFLEDLRVSGALAGDTPNQAYAVRRITPSEDAESSHPCLRVSIALRKPNEFLRYDLRLMCSPCIITRIHGIEADQLAG